MLVNFVIFFRFSSHLLFSFFFLFSALKFFSLFIWAFPLVVGVFVAAAVSSHIFMLMRPSLFFILVVVFLLFPPHWCFVVFSSPLKKKCELTHSLTCTFNRLKKKRGKNFCTNNEKSETKTKNQHKKATKILLQFSWHTIFHISFDYFVPLPVWVPVSFVVFC